jgi:hypothetical protein
MEENKKLAFMEYWTLQYVAIRERGGDHLAEIFARAHKRNA